MPPTMPTVPAESEAWEGLVLVSPIAAPAALRIAVSSDATPMATSQPKNAAPQLRPPCSSRWRPATSRGAGKPSPREVSARVAPRSCVCPRAISRRSWRR